MTQDVTAGIGIQIDSAGALAQLRQLQAGISQFNQSVVSTNAAAVAKQRDLISSFAHQVEATKQFSTGITNVETSVHRLGKSIDTGRLKLGDYFSYGMAASGKFNKAFSRQHAEIMQVATDRVKRLQTQYVALGESSNGMTKALAVRPLNLFNAQSAIATQRMQLFNKLVSDGTTSLINWGKNTQWAGRQLMVGFTVPLTVFGVMAAKTFTDIEKAMVSFKRVYGDTMTTDAETDKALQNIKSLAVEYTKYGIAVSDTIQLGAKAAALGAEGPDLIAQTEQATRLATLGQIDYQQALDTTISLQTAFGISAQDLGSNIDFLNAVENQTVLSIDDITESIPKVAPVIQALGGNVKDLAYMLTAMREGGVNAAEGSNALKSGLMSLINPTQAAIDKAKELGIDLQGIVQANNGDLPGMIKAIGAAFNSIDDSLAKQQLMGKIFGKYQVARMTAMFTNISKEGGQASRVLDLMGRSTQNLATLSEKELGKVENAVSTKWAGSLERLKAEIAPLGQTFLELATKIVDFITPVLKWFNDLNPAIKGFVVGLTAIGGVALPVITMLVGLFANMIGNIVKVGIWVKNLFSGFRKGAGDAQYLATAQLDTMAAAASLEGRVTTLTGSLNVQASAVMKLAQAYESMSAAAASALRMNPAGFRIGKLPGYAKGRVQIVPGNGSGKKDTELAMLAPGEAVINAEDSKRFAPLLAAINNGKLPGYADGKTESQSVNIGGNSVSYRPWGKGAPEKMQALANEVVAEGSQFANMLIKMFAELQAEAVSVNKVANKLVSSGMQNLMDIGNKYVSIKGLGAPNDFAKAKTEGLKSNPGLARYYEDQFNQTTNATRQWAKTHGQTLPSGALSQANFGTHISHLSKTSDESGKQWMSKRVGVDSGYLNRYLQDTEGAMGRLVKTFVEMDKGGQQFAKGEKEAAQLFLQSAKDVGLSADDARRELALLAQGLHPQTTKAVMAVKAIATSDLAMAQKQGWTGKTQFGTDAGSAWKAYAAQQAAQFSLANNGASRVRKSTSLFSGVKGTMWDKDQGKYRTMTSEEFAKADKAADSVLNKVKRFASKFANGLVTSLATAGGSMDIAQKALEIHSPSAAFVKIGKGVADGAIIAAEDLKVSGLKIRKSITDMALSISPATMNASTQIISGGASLTKAIKTAGLEIKEAELMAATTASSGQMAAPARRGSGRLQKGLFAADAAFMAGSFLPGQLGEFSQKLMFASMGLQAFTGLLDGMAAASAVAKAGSALAPIAKFAPLAGTALGALASPVGIAVASLAALGGIAWLVYNHYVEQEKALKAFGEAVKTSTTTLSGFASRFGYSETISSIQTRTTATDKGAQNRAVNAQTAVRDQMSSDEGFKTKMETLRKATEAQAEQILRQTFVSLVASGAPANVAKSIVEQMANEVNRQNIFKSIGESLDAAVDKNGKIKDVAKVIKSTLAPGFDRAASSAKEVAKQQQIIADLEKRGAYNLGGGTYGTKTYSPEDLRALTEAKVRLKALTDEGEQLKASMPATIEQITQDLNKLLGAGVIDQKEFIAGFNELKTSVTNMFPNDAAAQANAYASAIKGLGVEIDFNNPAMKDAAVAAATLNAVMSGADPSDINAALTSAAGNANVATAALNALAAAALSNPVVNGTAGTATLDAQIAATRAQIANLSKGTAKKKTGGGGGGGGGAAPKSKYDKKADRIAKANARLDIAEVKIDRTEDAKIQAAMDKRWGGKTIEIDGLKVTVKNSADVEYAMQQIDEKIEDINRNQIDPLNDKLDKLHDTQDAINRQIDEYQQEIDKINEAYDAQSKPLERANELLENQQAVLEEQRDKQLEGIDLQTTALQNQIDTAQYAAEIQGQLIDDQIEKNNVNLDLIQKQIDAIDDQVDALEAVKQINDILAAQKQSQLGLASALSSGDAGAAASAMLESQSTAANGASQLQQAGLEAQRNQLQSQADAISAQNDLLTKRKDAIDKGVEALNRQLAALTQQRTVIENNYKLELQGIANSIAANSARIRQLDYERTTRVAFWQDQIDRYAPALRDLDNQIYVIEQKIKKIQDEKIKPLERQRDLLDDILGDVKQQIAREKAVIDQKRKQLEYANKINSAMKTLYDRSKNAAKGAGGIGGALSSANKELEKLKKKLRELEGEKFRTKIEQGLVIRDQHGRIKVMDSPEDVRQAIQYSMGRAAIVTKNDINGAVKIGGKTVKGDYKTLSEKVAEAMDNPVKKEIVSALYKDKDQYKIKIIKTDDSVSLSGPGRARGGFIGGGFRGVAHGDNVLTPMRSGEGVTVAEAFRRNKFEMDRLNALNKAALSGNMGGFYREWSAPQLTNTVANVQPVATTSGATIHNEYNFDISGGPNVNTDELVNKVVYKIKESQRGQIRSM